MNKFPIKIRTTIISIKKIISSVSLKQIIVTFKCDFETLEEKRRLVASLKRVRKTTHYNVVCC